MLSIVKTYLGIDDALQDGLLTQIINDISQRVNNYVNEDALPSQLEWIVRELVIIRYNRIGSEGMTSESEEGKSLNFKDDPFTDYIPELDKFLEGKQEPAGRGRAKFI